MQNFEPAVLGVATATSFLQKHRKLKAPGWIIAEKCDAGNCYANPQITQILSHTLCILCVTFLLSFAFELAAL